MRDDRDFTMFAGPRAGIDRQPDQPLDLTDRWADDFAARLARPDLPRMPFAAQAVLVAGVVFGLGCFVMGAAKSFGVF